MVKHDFCKGNADLILCHAKWYCKTKAEKIEYLKWALDIFYNSPKYVLRNEIEAAKLKKDFEEYSLDPEKFKRKYTKTITPADGTRYEMTYREELDPWTEIENEIERLQAEGPGQIKNKKERGMHFDFIEPIDSLPDKIYTCSILRSRINVSANAFYNWHTFGKKICKKYKIQDWENLKYDVLQKDKLKLKISENSQTVIKKDLVAFLKFTGQV